MTCSDWTGKQYRLRLITGRQAGTVRTFIRENAQLTRMASVPVDERTKALIDRLRDEIERETGREVTRAEVLDRLVERGYEAKTDIVDSFRDDFDGLSEEEIEQWLSGTAASGDPVSDDEIDRALSEEALEE